MQLDPLSCKEIKCLAKLASLSGSDEQDFRLIQYLGHLVQGE